MIADGKREDKPKLVLAAGFGGFFLLGFFFLLFGLQLVAYQLENGDLGAVANADPGRDDTGIAACAICELGRDLAEELLRDARRHDVRSRLPPRLQCVALP